MISTIFKLLNKNNIKKIFLAAIIYSLATIPGKLLLMLLPGAEVRLAACLPVVFGLLWGMPGAIGVAFGNLFSDIYGGEAYTTCFWGFMSNFILAYLPYKLWYGWHSKCAASFIYNTKSCLRFFLIVFIVVFNFATLLTAIICLNFNSHPLQSFTIFFSSNYDFTLLLGVPLLLYFRKNNLFSLPQQSQPCKIRNSSLQPPILSFLLSTIASLLFLMATYLKYITPIAVLAFLVINTTLLLYACQLKPNYNEATETSPQFYSISAKATMIILILAIITIIFIIVLSLQANNKLSPELKNLGLWQDIFTTLLFSMNFVFMVVLFLIHKLEKNIVAPITTLSKAARNFVDNNYLNTANTLSPTTKTNTNDEIHELYFSFNKMTADIQKYMTDWQLATKEKEAIAAQLSVGAEIQQSILPNPAEINAKLKGYEIKAGMYPAKEVGGDLYDCFFIAPDKLVVLIADVSGKGIPAALFMMVTKTLLKSKSNLNDPALILAEVNNALTEHNENMMFVTVWLGIVELTSGKLTYANAGHNYPLLQQDDGKVLWLKEKSGPALGIIPDIAYKNYEQYLNHDSKLLLYTDGISEAENNSHEFYGTKRLEARFRRAHIPEDILFSVQEFIEDNPPSDDITLLWLQRK